MIKECNFKWKRDDGKLFCDLSGGKCKEEDNCILYQIYKNIMKSGYIDVEKYHEDSKEWAKEQAKKAKKWY